MPAFVDFMARAAIHIGTAVLSVALFAIVACGCMIGIGGTGGFTASPPPEHPAWLGLFLLIGVGSLIQWGLLRGRSLLLSALDRQLLKG